MNFKVFIILLVFIIFGCVSKKEYSYRQKPMCAYSNVAYVGTFSSVSVIKNKGETLFNDSLTAFANYIYDSVIKAKVRNITPVNVLSKLKSSQIKSLTEDLTYNALQFETKLKLGAITPAPMLDSIANLYDNRYTSYFLTFGNIWSKKQNRKHIAGQTLLISAVVIGFAVLAVLAASAGGNLGGLGSSKGDSYADSHWHGMTSYYLIYDKQEKKVCYLKSAFFNSDKTDNYPFNAQRVGNQIERIFNNCVR